MAYIKALEFLGLTRRFEPSALDADATLDYLRELERGESVPDHKMLEACRRIMLRSSLARAQDRLEGLYLVARQCYLAGRVNDGMLPARMALSIAQSLRDTGLSAKVQLLLGNLMLSEGLYDLAVEQLIEAQLRATAARDTATEVAALNAIGVAWLRQGMVKEAREAFEKVYTACRKSSSLFESLVTAMMQLCWCAYQMHDAQHVLTVAKPVLRKLLKLIEKNPTALPRLWMLTQMLRINMARLHCELKQPDEAAALLSAIKMKDEEFGAHRVNTAKLSVEGALLVRQGKLRAGLAKVEQALKASKLDVMFFHDMQIVKARTLFHADKKSDAAVMLTRIKKAQHEAASRSKELYRKQSARDLLSLDKAVSMLPDSPVSELISQVAQDIRESILPDQHKQLRKDKA
jgi:tetratricopeptide (TPR) repeat protein